MRIIAAHRRSTCVTHALHNAKGTCSSSLLCARQRSPRHVKPCRRIDFASTEYTIGLSGHSLHLSVTLSLAKKQCTRRSTDMDRKNVYTNMMGYLSVAAEPKIMLQPKQKGAEQKGFCRCRKRKRARLRSTPISCRRRHHCSLPFLCPSHRYPFLRSPSFTSLTCALRLPLSDQTHTFAI